MDRGALTAALALGVLLSLSGCAGGADAAPAREASPALQTAQGEDARIIAQLAEIAPRDAGISGVDTVTSTECWKPSTNMLDQETFRVLCRVHFEEAGTDRYRDMICIGNITEDPVAEYCFRWAYYSDMPRYADQAGYRAS